LEQMVHHFGVLEGFFLDSMHDRKIHWLFGRGNGAEKE